MISMISQYLGDQLHFYYPKLYIENLSVLLNRGTKALDPVWKQHRRGIEWRCRWLELRTKAINAKLSLYDKSLKSLQNSKIWKFDGEVGEGTSSRTVPVKILRNHPVIHRKHRRRPEDAEGDLDLGRHPVFSRYGTKGDPESSFSVQVHCCLPGNSVIAALTSLSYTHVHYASCVLSRQTVMKYTLTNIYSVVCLYNFRCGPCENISQYMWVHGCHV